MNENIILKIASGLIPAVVNKLKSIQTSREDEINAIADIAKSDPFVLAKYYVEPDCQPFNPGDPGEEQSLYRSPILDFVNKFIETENIITEGANQMFVLSDAGMGKSSLLVMVKLFHLASFWPYDYNCNLMKLGPSSLEKIRTIKDKKDTVLLLDALDEDPNTREGIEKRITELLRETQVFKKVIITCRTQFFPESGQGLPSQQGVVLDTYRGRVRVGAFKCPVIFLSHFSEDQVHTYLEKRFPQDNITIFKAKQVIEQMHSLRCRPMLLAYIEELINDAPIQSDEYGVYQYLVSNWLSREIIKLPERPDEPNPSLKDLWNACTIIAIHLTKEGLSTLSTKELNKLLNSEPAIRHIPEMDIKGRSLINLNSYGEYRFSHLSIQEFLVSNLVVNGETGAGLEEIHFSDQIASFLNCYAHHAISEDTSVGSIAEKFNIHGFPMRLATFLSHADLKGVDLTYGNLKRADLQGANLQEANLQGAYLQHAKLQETDLQGANLQEANLEEADLFGAKLCGAILRDAKLEGIDLRQADLNGANLEGAILNIDEVDESLTFWLNLKRVTDSRKIER